MKTLITGGAGFIGSHLAEALCRRGAKVIVLDNLSFGKVENLAWKQPGDALELVEGDAGDEALLRRLLPGCDWVFHLAALPSVSRSVAEPRWTNTQNLDVALQVLEAARAVRVRRFVFASSSSVYGDNPQSPKDEAAAPHPVSPYGLQKYAAEMYTRMFCSLYGLPTVALRYFNVFGPRQSFDSPYSGVIARFCTALLTGQPPTVFGDGHQSRDFVYVTDVVAANLLAAETPADRVAGRVFNVGGGQGTTLLELLSELGRLTGRTPAPRFEPPRPGDIRDSVADIRAFQQATGYRVSVPWQAGLRQTLEFYRQRGQ